LSLATQSGDAQLAPHRKSDALPGNPPSADLLTALSGKDASRDQAVAYRTRRVVLGSLGVMKDQKQSRNRSRGVALAITVVVLALIAPLVWEATDSLIAGEHLADPGSQFSLWACFLCPTLLGAALVAGWWKHRS